MQTEKMPQKSDSDATKNNISRQTQHTQHVIMSARKTLKMLGYTMITQ